MFVLVRDLTEDQFDDLAESIPCVGTAKLCVVPADCFDDLKKPHSKFDTTTITWSLATTLNYFENEEFKIPEDKPVNDLVSAFIESQSDEKADALLVETITREITQRLCIRREQGRYGWFGPNCSTSEFYSSLVSHLHRGEILDVVIIASMIYARGQLYPNYPNT